MAVGSGVCSQFGFVNESTAGTPVTVTKFRKHVSVGGNGLEPIRVDSEAVGGCFLGVPYDRAQVEVARQSNREVVQECGTRTMGLLLKQMIGSAASATQIGATSVYRQIHHNGDVAGKSLTVQFGFPEATATGTNRAITMRGCKVSQWTLANAMNQLLRLTMTLDAWDETTATGLATAAYTTEEVYGWKHLTTLKIGGTPSIGSGLVSVSAGTAVANCRGVTLRGTIPIRTDGFFAGGGGSKSEQILTGGHQDFGGELECEFADRTQFYDVFSANTTTAFEAVWVCSTDHGSGTFCRLAVVMPYCRLITPGGNPMINGPGVLDGRAAFRAFADPAGSLPMIQIVYDSLDTAL